METVHVFLLLLFCVSIFNVKTEASDVYLINASIMGRPGQNQINLYREINDLLMKSEVANGMNHCYISFRELIFNTTDGKSVYESLQTARNNFEDEKVAVAVGPDIGVFTSSAYVILSQIHLLTSHSSEVSNRSFSIFPESKSMSDAIADIVKRLGWRNLALLAQDDFSPVLTLSSNNIRVWPIRLPPQISSENDAELKRNLIQLRYSQNDKFILHSNKREVIQYVMQAAKKLHLLHYSIDWFVTYPDFEDIIKDEDGHWPGSLFGLQLLKKDKLPVDVSENLMENYNISRLQLGSVVDVVGILRHVLRLIARDCSVPPMGGDYIVTDKQFSFWLQSEDQRYNGALGDYEWKRPGNARTNYSIDIVWYNTTMNKIGSCTFINGTPTVNFTTNQIGNDRQHAFGQVDRLRIVIKQDDPFVIKKPDGTYTGFNMDILEKLASRLNFEYDIIDVQDQLYNNSNNGSFDAMVFELMTGNASMAVGALEVTADKEEIISFSYTIISSKASLLIKKADNSRNFFQFLGPFSTGLWFMIVGFVIMAGMTMYVMSRYDQTQKKSERKFDLKESMWYSLNILLQGTTDYSPQTTSTRTIIAFFWFCLLIIDAAYTANLAAYLTLQQFDRRIRSVEDLASQTNILYGVERDSSLMHFLENAREDPYERMWAFIKLNGEETLLENKSQVIQKVSSGKFTFIADGVVNEYYAKQYCGIESVQQRFGHKDFSFGFPRGAPYRDDINRAVLQLKEEGELDNLKEKWWSAGANCTHNDRTRSIRDKATPELQIENMFGVFLVLAGFLLLAIVCEVIDRIMDCQRAKPMKDEADNGSNSETAEELKKTISLDLN